jgi:hypothetical protein
MADIQNPLLYPVLDGRTLTVDQALKQPTLIRDRIAHIADALLIAGNFYSPGGAQGVQGGGILYSITRAADQYLDGNLEERSPGSEYRQLQGVDPEVRLARVRDWGAKFKIEDERRIRNDVDYLDQQTTQLANTIAKKVDDQALKSLNDALDSFLTEQPDIIGHTWSNLVFEGPLDQLTPSAQRPTADWSAAQLAADLQQLGVKHDVIVTSPASAHALRTAYGDKLDLALESAGLELVSNVKVAVGTAYLAEKGAVGIVGFEAPLTVNSWPDYETRSTIVQGWAVPAFAVTHPFRVKRLTGIV